MGFQIPRQRCNRFDGHVWAPLSDHARTACANSPKPQTLTVGQFVPLNTHRTPEAKRQKLWPHGNTGQAAPFQRHLVAEHSVFVPT